MSRPMPRVLLVALWLACIAAGPAALAQVAPPPVAARAWLLLERPAGQLDADAEKSRFAPPIEPWLALAWRGARSTLLGRLEAVARGTAAGLAIGFATSARLFDLLARQC